MTDGVRRIDTERGAEVNEKRKRNSERVVRKDGKALDFPSDMLESVKDRFRPAGRNRNSPAEFFGMSDCYGSYEQGPDGLWFVWNDGWEPTELWRNGAQAPQRDPDGNVWLEANGEWEVEV